MKRRRMFRQRPSAATLLIAGLTTLAGFLGGWASVGAAAAEADDSRVEWENTLLIQLRVADLDRAVAFYTDTLGFALESRNDELQWARVKPGIENVTIGLGASGESAGSGTASMNFGVRDIDAARRSLEAAGVEFLGPTITVPGVVRLADFLDPDGHRIRLAEDLP